MTDVERLEVELGPHGSAWRLWVRAHDLQLDQWECEQKALIRERVIFANRSIGQRWRWARWAVA